MHLDREGRRRIQNGKKGDEQAVANKAGIHGQTKEQKAAARE